MRPFEHAELGILGHVVNIRKLPVDGVAFRLHFDPVAEPVHRLLERHLLRQHGAAGVELLAQHVGGKGERAAGMLFLAHAEEIRRVADLRLDLFLAIAVIVVGEDRHHDAAMVARRELEGRAAVVDLVFVTPAHAVAALPFGRGIVMRQAHVFLFRRPAR